VARSFLTNTHRVVYGTLNGFNWAWGSNGGVFYMVTADVSRDYIALDSGGNQFNFGVLDSNLAFYYDNSGVQGGSTSFVASAWYFLGISKATGSVTARAHIYKWNTRTWVHENLAGASQDGDATSVIIGNQLGNESMRGHMAAAFALPSRVMTDSEFERLPRGNWDLLIPDAERWEYKSGRDYPTVTASLPRSCGKYHMRATSVTGTARSAIVDPPGFRFSRLTQRH
jgi:hypothetical protein